MKMRMITFSFLISTIAVLIVACGGSADANKANLDMSSPAHDNQSPTVGDGGTVDNANSDLAKPATVNESPASGGGH